MSDGPLQQIFFLAEDEEDTMKTLARDYMLAQRKGGRALAAMRRRLWSLWIRKFPILFIQICGCYSTKDDEAYCRRKKLKCIEAYLTRLTMMIDAITLPRRDVVQVLVAPDTDAPEPPAELHPSVPALPSPFLSSALFPVTPQNPCHSPRLKECKQPKTLPITPSPSVMATSKVSPGSSEGSSSLFSAGSSSATSSPVRTYVDRRRSMQTVLSYPVVKRRSLMQSMRACRG
ncbi:hypothetical protein ARMGADRAFT_1022605 [Armillaria gallica]|uniref:Uncharacterized protein n=1 Tax=Armillaria gallica TaxID=47427 RepID=A0A2H3ENK4_ARMGA|nr:hypothetical protein ARMGADRAFT_1022605 [Armillaria gallica]